jgi:hypothetical protein
MPEEFYDRDFPDLRRLGFVKTSEPAYYNCIAYLVGDFRRKWWPGEFHPDWSDDFWPEGGPAEETVAAFAAALLTVGFQLCDDAERGELEAGVEKVALYARDGKVCHGAIQQPDGTWRSKLGPEEDIEHPLEGLQGPCYGQVTAFLRRPRRTN